MTDPLLKEVNGKWEIRSLVNVRRILYKERVEWLNHQIPDIFGVFYDKTSPFGCYSDSGFGPIQNQTADGSSYSEFDSLIAYVCMRQSCD